MLLVQDLWAALVLLIYIPVRFVYDVFLGYWWKLNGTHQRFIQSRLPENYGFSAHVLDIKWKRSEVFPSFFKTMLPGRGQFFLVHRGFADPTIVLRDTVSLYYFTKDEAAFVVVDEDVDVTQLATDCFMRDAQTRYAKQLIVMPLLSFHKLAQKVGPPRGQLVFVGNTGRCGSTLLVQIFQETKKAMCLSEPHVLEIVVDSLQELPVDVCKKLLQSCISLLCKPHSTGDYEAYLLKPMAFTSKLHLLLKEVYPDARHIFMYRDCIPNTQSMVQLFSSLSTARLMYMLSLATIPKKKVLSLWFPSESFEEDVEVEHFSTLLLGMCFCHWCKICKLYFDAREKGVQVAALKYEHLLEDPKGTMKRVLSHLALPESWAEVAPEAMRLDSQRSGVGSVRHRKKVVFTGSDRGYANKMLVRYGIPSIDEPCLLPGTL